MRGVSRASSEASASLVRRVAPQTLHRKSSERSSSTTDRRRSCCTGHISAAAGRNPTRPANRLCGYAVRGRSSALVPHADRELHGRTRLNRPVEPALECRHVSAVETFGHLPLGGRRCGRRFSDACRSPEPQAARTVDRARAHDSCSCDHGARGRDRQFTPRRRPLSRRFPDRPDATGLRDLRGRAWHRRPTHRQPRSPALGKQCRRIEPARPNDRYEGPRVDARRAARSTAARLFRHCCPKLHTTMHAPGNGLRGERHRSGPCPHAGRSHRPTQAAATARPLTPLRAGPPAISR